MTLRGFLSRLAGLSFESRWARALQADQRAHGDEVVLEGAAAEAWWAGLS